MLLVTSHMHSGFFAFRTTKRFGAEARGRLTYPKLWIGQQKPALLSNKHMTVQDTSVYESGAAPSALVSSRKSLSLHQPVWSDFVCSRFPAGSDSEKTATVGS